jgi:chaperonin cofactor prefoldin
VLGQSCDSFGNAESSIQRVLSRKRQLDKEQREADQALGTALARVERLRRQRELLESEALRMFRKEGEVLVEQERREVASAPSAFMVQECVPQSLSSSSCVAMVI